MPAIHDLREIDADELYDVTQTCDQIKDGDFMVFRFHERELVAYMDKAWPVQINNLEVETVFHQFTSALVTAACYEAYMQLRGQQEPVPLALGTKP